MEIEPQNLTHWSCFFQQSSVCLTHQVLWSAEGNTLTSTSFPPRKSTETNKRHKGNSEYREGNTTLRPLDIWSPNVSKSQALITYFWSNGRVSGSPVVSASGRSLKLHGIQKALRTPEWEKGYLTHLRLLLSKQLHHHQIPIQGSVASNNPINKNVPVTILHWKEKINIYNYFFGLKIIKIWLNRNTYARGARPF